MKDAQVDMIVYMYHILVYIGEATGEMVVKYSFVIEVFPEKGQWVKRLQNQTKPSSHPYITNKTHIVTKANVKI